MKIFERLCTLVTTVFLLSAFTPAAEAMVLLGSSLSLAERYNDNLNFTETDEREDFATLLTMGLDLNYESKRAILSTSYQGSMEFHTVNEETDQYYQNLTLNMEFPGLERMVKGVSVRIIEKVSYSPEMPAFTFGEFQEVEEFREGVEGIRTTRSDIFSNTSGIELAYPWTRRLSTTALYAYKVVDYTDENIADFFRHTANLVLIYAVSERTNWNLGYTYEMKVFGREEDAVSHTVSTGFTHQYSEELFLSAKAGVTIVEDEDALLTVDAGVSRHHQSGTVTLEFRQGIGTGSGLTTVTTMSQNVRLSIMQELTKYLNGFVQLGYAKNKTVSSGDLDTKSFEANLGLSMGFLSWLSGSLDYTFNNQESEGVLGTDATRNLVTLTFTASSTPWKIID